jgi:hypothetical protein
VSAVPTPVLAPIRIAVHLAPSPDGATSGTFVATGVVGDSGTVPALERFSGLRRGLRQPLVTHGAEALAGAGGAISIGYDGVFRPVRGGVFAGEGRWRVLGGDHAYERLHAEGTWTTTAVVGPDGLKVDIVFQGAGLLR